MKFFKVVSSLFLYIFLVIIYFALSTSLKLKMNIIFSAITFIAVAGIIIKNVRKLITRDAKSPAFNKFGTVNALVIGFVFLLTICAIDYGNLVILKRNSQNVSVHKILADLKKSEEAMASYDKLFKTVNHDNTTMYVTPDEEPASNLLKAYLDTAFTDCQRLFGNFATSPLTIKLDYSEEVFKNREKGSVDYAGVYFPKEKTAYIYVKDCYESILALNFGTANTRQTFFHEYAHHIFFEFLNSNQIPESKIPQWFIEGISEYIGNQGANGYPPRVLVPFKNLNIDEQWRSYSTKDYSIYEQSHYAVSQMILMKGEGVIRDVLLKTKDRDFNTAFKDSMGESIESFEKSFSEDFKNDWKKYNKMTPVYKYAGYEDIRISAFEKYLKINPDNVDALLDLSQLYENKGELDRAKTRLSTAVKLEPGNAMAWRRLALINEKMGEFDNAIKAYEKEISIVENPAVSYISLAHVLLLKDMDKALETAQKVRKYDKSKFISKQVQAVINFSNAIKNGKPYEGCLQLIKGSTINSDSIEKALIGKMLRDYPNIRSQARNELERIYGKFK